MCGYGYTPRGVHDLRVLYRITPGLSGIWGLACRKLPRALTFLLSPIGRMAYD